ncbi:MAG: hypothetical protein ACJ79J_02545 [Gemmatimonadaceae bacterium]|jgi:hypothetical protein
MKGLYPFALVAVVACASAGGSSAGMPAQDRNYITGAELLSLPSSSLYDAIEKLRPHFLRARGASSIGGQNADDYASVYLDGRPYGDINSLRSLVPAQIAGVRYYDSISAQQKYGITKGSGVIDVMVKTGQ